MRYAAARQSRDIGICSMRQPRRRPKKDAVGVSSQGEEIAPLLLAKNGPHDSCSSQTSRVYSSADSDGRVGGRRTGDNGDIPIGRVALAFAQLLILAVYGFGLGLGSISEDVLVASFRTFLQLTVLAAILTSVFASKTHSSFVTLAYLLFFMLPLAAYEATARSQLTHDGAYLAALVGLASGVILSLLFTVLVVVRPEPLCSPRIVIPLGGMLISNSLSGTALAVSDLLDALKGQAGRIDVLLAMGATPLEATSLDLAAALARGLVPHLNSMNVIGLVAIPGMMTGQIIAGGSPGRAVRYQMMIMYMVAASTGISSGMTLAMTIGQLFNSRGVFLTNEIVPNKALRVSQFISGEWTNHLNLMQTKRLEDENAALKNSEDQSPLALRAVHIAPNEANVMLDIRTTGTLAQGRRFNADISLRRGEISCLFGSSGIGKSTLLRAVAELSSMGAIDGLTPLVLLNGVERHQYEPSEWRRRVMYVPQNKASELQGTPIELLTSVNGLATRRADPTSEAAITRTVLNYLNEWDIPDPQGMLERSWGDMSGGEAQRVLLAISFSSESEVMLLDEPTSSLDERTKTKVEASLLSLGRAVLMVTHEEDQAVRLGASRFQLAPIDPLLN